MSKIGKKSSYKTGVTNSGFEAIPSKFSDKKKYPSKYDKIDGRFLIVKDILMEYKQALQSNNIKRFQEQEREIMKKIYLKLKTVPEYGEYERKYSIALDIIGILNKSLYNEKGHRINRSPFYYGCARQILQLLNFLPDLVISDYSSSTSTSVSYFSSEEEKELLEPRQTKGNNEIDYSLGNNKYIKDEKLNDNKSIKHSKKRIIIKTNRNKNRFNNKKSSEDQRNNTNTKNNNKNLRKNNNRINNKMSFEHQNSNGNDKNNNRINNNRFNNKKSSGDQSNYTNGKNNKYNNKISDDRISNKRTYSNIVKSYDNKKYNIEKMNLSNKLNNKIISDSSVTDNSSYDTISDNNSDSDERDKVIFNLSKLYEAKCKSLKKLTVKYNKLKKIINKKKYLKKSDLK